MPSQKGLKKKGELSPQAHKKIVRNLRSTLELLGEDVNREGFTTNRRSSQGGAEHGPRLHAPLSTDAAVKAIIEISPGDTERIMGKPSKARPKLPKKD